MPRGCGFGEVSKHRGCQTASRNARSVLSHLDRDEHRLVVRVLSLLCAGACCLPAALEDMLPGVCLKSVMLIPLHNGDWLRFTVASYELPYSSKILELFSS